MRDEGLAAASILTIASQKGGAGKTTLARVLAPTLARRGLRIACIDADPNRGLADWLELYAGRGPAVTLRAEADERALARLPATLAKDHDVVLVDTAGFGSRSMVVAIGAADAVLIPCQPDRSSVREAQQTADWCSNLSASVRREIPCRIAMVAFDPKRTTDAFARTQLETGLGLPMLASALSDRTGYQALTWNGTMPTIGPVWREAEALADELIELGWLPGVSAHAEKA
jgi:chromosome partitioning protein